MSLHTPLNTASIIALVELFESKSLSEQLSLFKALDVKKGAQLFEYLPLTIQKNLLNQMDTGDIAPLLNALAPDDRTGLLENLSDQQVAQLLKYLSPEERALSIKLLGYPENSVGRLMTPDYIAIHLEWTVQEILDYIRKKGQDSETVNIIYAIDSKGVLIDDFRIQQFLIADPHVTAETLSDHKFVYLHVTDEEQSAIALFRKTSRVALPVVDTNMVLLGIVTIDDIMHVSIAKDTETMQKIGGIAVLDMPYMHTPFLQLMQKRIGWLSILFIGEMLTASALGFFEKEIARAVVLALFLPLIVSSGGNAGAQASTLIIRAMALGEIKLKDWWQVVRREVYAGLFLGASLGLIGFMRVTLWSLFSTIYGTHWLLIALTLFFSLMGTVLWGTLSGSTLPLILSRLGFDPAVSSTPFVATLVDVVGIIIYFSLALFFLHGTLL